jgi:hypothetical protein
MGARLTTSEIVWEFPEDEVGKPIDALHEGNPVVWEDERVADETA